MQPLLLNHYSFIYLYTDGTHRDKSIHIPKNTVIHPQQTLVFWYNPQGKTHADFNTLFGNRIPEGQIISFKDEFPSFFNWGNRGLAIKEKSSQTTLSASYLTPETRYTGKAVQYQYSKTNVEMVKLATFAYPTPGTFESTQVPTTPVNLEVIQKDIVPPVIKH